MARVLLGWELGAGRGHAVRLSRLADLLRTRGDTVILAVQQLGVFAGEADAWQAPLWPGQLVALARRAPAAPRSMGDILATLGLGDTAAMTGLMRAWDGILAATRPDIVAAEFAPGLMMAARGRVPLLGLGNGFTLPPADLERFPALGAEAAREDEAPLFDRLNKALALCGRPLLDALPGVFASDAAHIATFAELDPYRTSRGAGHGAPATDGPVPLAGEAGEGLFVYLSEPARLPAGFLEGLAGSGLPVTLHARTLSAGDGERLVRFGFRVESAPVPFVRIVQEARLLLSQGGLGFVSSALLAGLPQLILPFDMEKALTADAVAGLGLGERLLPDGFSAATLADAVGRLAHDTALAERAREAAGGFRARMPATAEEEALTAMDALLGR